MITALWTDRGPLVGVALAGIAIIAISEVVRRRFGPAAEWTRKLVHVLMGLLSLSLPYVFHSAWPVMLLCTAFALALGMTMLLGLLSSVHGVERASGGVILYPVAVALLFYLTAQRPGFYVVCILVMTVCDAAAALVGSEYGRHTFHIHGNVKSVEGSLVFLLTAFICAHVPLLLMTPIDRAICVLVGLLIAVLVTVFEALSVGGIDNLIVPYGTYFILIRAYDESVIELVRLVIILIAVAVLILLLSRLPRSLVGSAVLAVILMAYGTWVLGAFDWFLAVILLVSGFCVLWALPRQAASLPKDFELREVFHVFLLPFVLVWSANAWGVHEILFLPFLATITTAFVLICYEWLGLAYPLRAGVGHGRRLLAALTIGLGLILAPALAVHRRGGYVAFCLVAVSSLLSMAVFVGVIEKRVRNHRAFLRRLVLVEGLAMTLVFGGERLLE